MVNFPKITKCEYNILILEHLCTVGPALACISAGKTANAASGSNIPFSST